MPCNFVSKMKGNFFTCEKISDKIFFDENFPLKLKDLIYF